MTTSLTPSAPTATGSTARRRPATVLGAAALTLLVCLVGSYGAVYFSSLDGLDEEGLTFLFAYVPVAAFGVVSALALLRGSEPGRLGVLAYALWLNVFNAFKVLYVRETEALPFAVVGLLILAAVLSPAARRWTRG